MSALQSLGKWLRLKQYQIEVTFGVYIFTPIEKFVFWSVVFLLFSLTFIATVLYLPQHIVFLINRAWFYAYGEDQGVEQVLGGLAKGAMQQHTMNAVATSAADSAAAVTVESLVREL